MLEVAILFVALAGVAFLVYFVIGMVALHSTVVRNTSARPGLEWL